MSFLIKNFSPVGGQASRGSAPSEWSYVSLVDSIPIVVNTVGYFNEIAFLLKVGDFINVQLVDGHAIIRVDTIVLSPNADIVGIDKENVIQPKPITPHASVLIFSAISQGTASTTLFLLPGGQNRAAVDGTVEDEIRLPLPRAGKLSMLAVRHGLPGDGTNVPITYELRQDGNVFPDGSLKVDLLNQDKQAINSSDVVTAAPQGALAVKIDHSVISGGSNPAARNIYVTVSFEAT